jgi:hypothetical protein
MSFHAVTAANAAGGPQMHSFLIVYSDPVAERHDEFNSWYTDVHIRDVMSKVKGAIAVQRFRRSPHQVEPNAGRHKHEYLAIYEMSDPQKFTEGHDIVFTEAMPISDAFNMESGLDVYYDPIIARSNAPGSELSGSAIIQRISGTAIEPETLAWYRETRFAELMRLPGINSGFFAGASAHQMMPIGRDATYTGVFRTDDLPGTLDAWQALEMASPSRFVTGQTMTDCFEPLIARLKSFEVIHADEAARKREARARSALGNRVHRSAPHALPGSPDKA